MKKSNCSVNSNCLTRKTDCWLCDNFGLYKPKDKKIKSPRQEQIALEKKLQKKVKRQSTASKRGKANRRNGRNAERELVKWFEKNSIESNLVPMSGALKSANIIAALANDEMVEKMRGDIKVVLNGETYTVESKRDVNTDSLYKKAESGVLHIKDFCYMLRQDLFLALVNGADLEHIDVDDKGFKKIHGYFSQDNADIVVISRPYCDRLFFVTEELWSKLRKKQ